MNVCPSQFWKLAPGSYSVGFYVTKAELFPCYREKSSIPALHFFTKRVLVFIKALEKYFTEVRVLAKTRDHCFTAPPKSIFVSCSPPSRSPAPYRSQSSPVYH